MQCHVSLSLVSPNVKCHMSNLKTSYVPCHYIMSHVKFKKCSCRPVDFRGQGLLVCHSLSHNIHITRYLTPDPLNVCPLLFKQYHCQYRTPWGMTTWQYHELSSTPIFPTGYTFTISLTTSQYVLLAWQS